MSAERTAEIWSTRVQRELLALTSDNVDDEAKAEVALLPPFITVKDHRLDIAKGTCGVSFLIEVEKRKKVKAKKMERADDTQKEKSDPREKKAGEEDFSEAEDLEDAVAPLTYVTVTLDASLDTKPDGTVDASPMSYPFQKPRAILSAGAELFPRGSPVKNGDYIDIDCDWTPSLHLSDAILNVALKIRESIKQGEPFFAAVVERTPIDPIEVAQKSAKRLGSLFSSVGKGFSMSAAAPESNATKQPREKPRKQKPKQRKQPSDGSVQIGDVIDLTQSPWNVCAGMYSCKAIRRPEFVEAAILAAEAENKKNEVAGAGFAGAGSMFRSFTLSAKSVFEESFIMITDEQIIELRSNKLSISSGTVTFAIPVSFLAKLKFRRHESLSLFFKPAPDDPLIYMCPDSADAVHQIQNVLKQHGVKGKHTNAATQRAIQAALNIVVEIQKKEKALEIDPTVEKVDEIMDLYRQAAEKFEVAGDARHEEVMTHMHKFLAKPLTISILDGSYAKKKQAASATQSSVPQGEVLESTTCQLEEDDDDDMKSTEDNRGKKSGDDDKFHETMDDILQEAKRDLENFGVEDDLDGLLTSSTTGGDSRSGAKDDEHDHDPVAELDDMLKAADKELADIMDS